jgi:hypothetical protein
MSRALPSVIITCGGWEREASRQGAAAEQRCQRLCHFTSKAAVVLVAGVSACGTPSAVVADRYVQYTPTNHPVHAAAAHLSQELLAVEVLVKKLHLQRHTLVQASDREHQPGVVEVAGGRGSADRVVRAQLRGQ